MANVDKLLRQAKKKKKAGDKLYPFGVQITIPQFGTDVGEVAATTMTFKGSFDKRKLRRMIKSTLVTPITTQQADFIIDNFATKLRPMKMEEVLAWAGTDDA